MSEWSVVTIGHCQVPYSLFPTLYSLFSCRVIAFAMGMENENDQADRAISTGKLHTLQRFHTRPINVVVFHDSQGMLVLRWVSRLDAFSGYPVRT